MPAEGKSTVARNLAFACADAGDRVLLVDCDLRRPSVARVFGVNPEIGLAQVLRREASPADATVTVFRTNAPDEQRIQRILEPRTPSPATLAPTARSAS